MASPAGAVTLTLASGEPTTPNGQPDPNTLITPGGVGRQAVITTLQPIPGKPVLSGARWISRAANAASAPGVVNYTYTRRFTLPACIRNATIQVRMMADDLGSVSLNGTTIGTNASFGSISTFNNATALVPGTNTLVFTVQDLGALVTGLDYAATINYDLCETGLVKVCKIAGPGADWPVAVNPTTRRLDGRATLVTDDDQRIYMTYDGVLYTPPTGQGERYWRAVPVFRTDSAKYEWLNRIVAVGVNYTVPQRIGYRIFQVL
jgi:hypothetical protein